MSGLIMASQLILALMILVGIHEFGHMITAKWFKMRVEKFSIGFPPKLFGFKKGDTEYMLGLLPLGGFVKISGMIDESMDKEQMKQPPKDYEFRSKPAWQRLIVMLGGIILNVVTGILIFSLMLFFIGITYLPVDQLKNGIVAHELAEEIGLKTGDVITEINGKSYTRFSELSSADVLLGSNAYYTVRRGDSLFKVALPADMIERLSLAQKKGQGFISPFMSFSVKRILPESPAEKAGLAEGDVILKVNKEDGREFSSFREALQSFKGQEVSLLVASKDGTERNLQAKVSEEGTLGFEIESDVQLQTETLSLPESFSKGTVRAFSVVFVQLKAFGKMFKGEINPANSLSGPIGIAQQFGSTWEWERFWGMTGLLSMVLAFMNLLPIPALDGGHVVFLTYEIVSGRKPGEKFMENAQKFGMIFLLLLMAFVIGKEAIEGISSLF